MGRLEAEEEGRRVPLPEDDVNGRESYIVNLLAGAVFTYSSGEMLQLRGKMRLMRNAIVPIEPLLLQVQNLDKFI